MSATKNPRVHVREAIHDDKPAFIVSIDGDDVTSIGYGPMGSVEFGEGEFRRDMAEFTAEAVASLMVSSLPKAPVEVSLRANVIAHVTAEGVVKVHIVPDQSVITDVFDANGNSPGAVRAALEYVNTETWAPLHDLPDNVVWEG
jgi:hypothetical protein